MDAWFGIVRILANYHLPLRGAALGMVPLGGLGGWHALASVRDFGIIRMVGKLPFALTRRCPWDGATWWAFCRMPVRGGALKIRIVWDFLGGT